MSALILVADDDPFNLRLLQELCEAAGYQVVTADNGGDVLAVVARERPDLILLDVAMPVMDGFEVLAILKTDADLAAIPVVLVTAAGNVEARSRGIELGADDYITKPYRVFEIQQRIRNALRVAEGEARKRESVRAGTVDPLTHAGTSQQLLISLNYEYTRAARYGHQLTCIVARIGNYHDLVTEHGDDVGEGLLVQLANGLRGCVRGIDHLFRSDLDEFAILLPETGLEGSQVVVDRINHQSADGTLWSAALSPMPTIEIGRAGFPGPGISNSDELLRLALDDSRKGPRH